MKPVLNIDEVALEKHGHGDRFAAATGSLSLPIGAKAIGARLVKVPPGKRAWPYHCHYGNEEMFIIQSGTGTYRYGGEEYPVRPGDVLAAPAGGHETARQLVNSGNLGIRILPSMVVQENTDVHVARGPILTPAATTEQVDGDHIRLPGFEVAANVGFERCHGSVRGSVRQKTVLPVVVRPRTS